MPLDPSLEALEAEERDFEELLAELAAERDARVAAGPTYAPFAKAGV